MASASSNSKLVAPSSKHVESQCGDRYGQKSGNGSISLPYFLHDNFHSTWNLITVLKSTCWQLLLDSIKRDKLINAMKGFKIPNKLVPLTEAILRRVTCSVKIYNDVSKSFTTQRGVRQGDVLACLLFNLALEKVIQNAGIEKTWHNLP